MEEEKGQEEREPGQSVIVAVLVAGGGLGRGRRPAQHGKGGKERELSAELG